MDDPNMHAYAEHYRPLRLREWVEERRLNCLRLSKEKSGADRAGWLEDAAYFQLILDALPRAAADSGVEAAAPAKPPQWLKEKLIRTGLAQPMLDGLYVNVDNLEFIIGELAALPAPQAAAPMTEETMYKIARLALAEIDNDPPEAVVWAIKLALRQQPAQAAAEAAPTPEFSPIQPIGSRIIDHPKLQQWTEQGYAKQMPDGLWLHYTAICELLRYEAHPAAQEINRINRLRNHVLTSRDGSTDDVMPTHEMAEIIAKYCLAAHTVEAEPPGAEFYDWWNRQEISKSHSENWGAKLAWNAAASSLRDTNTAHVHHPFCNADRRKPIGAEGSGCICELSTKGELAALRAERDALQGNLQQLENWRDDRKIEAAKPAPAMSALRHLVDALDPRTDPHKPDCKECNDAIEFGRVAHSSGRG